MPSPVQYFCFILLSRMSFQPRKDFKPLEVSEKPEKNHFMCLVYPTTLF